MTGSGRPTVVVCAPGGQVAFGLPSSSWTDRVWVWGGERTLYELAFAAAAAGFEVELRGEVSRPVFDELAAVTAAHPAVGHEPRRPRVDDIVVVPESLGPLELLGVVGSEARAVLVQLAPIGLFGWSFDGPVADRPDPLTVDPAAVGTPRHLRVAHDLGFELWTHSSALAAHAEAAGVRCRWIGSGSPGPAPAVATTRDTDVVVIGGNRWEPLARSVVAELDVTVRTTPADVPNATVLAELASARLLVHPARVEGHSRLGIEARRMGTVPVMLATNPYLAGASEDEGLVAVDAVDELAGAIRALLADPARLGALSRAGRAFAERWVAWEPYVERVGAALAAGRDDGPRPLEVLGGIVADRERVAAEVAARQAAAVAAAEATATARAEAAVALAEARARADAELAAARAEADTWEAQAADLALALRAVEASRTWRLRTWATRLPGARLLHRRPGPPPT